MAAGTIMYLAGLALLAAMAILAQDPPRFVVPNSADLTIRLRARDGSVEQNVTIRLKGARQVRERRTDTPGGSSAIIMIGQCDHRRIVLLNPGQKTYAYTAIHPPATGSPPPSGATVVTSSHTTYSREEIVVDAVDTGERRQLGGLTARHVVTTTTTTDGGAIPSSVRTRVQDGWYVDLPQVDCIESAGTTLSLSLFSGSMAGVVAAPPRVTVRGRAKPGVALIETDRTTGPEGTWEQTTELVEISTAPLDAALFDVPAGYRAALPYRGGFDLSRPDTVGNRLSLLWEGMRGLAARWWP